MTAQATDLEGRSILIAGASGGLGSAVANNLAARGARLTLVARRPDLLGGSRHRRAGGRPGSSNSVGLPGGGRRRSSNHGGGRLDVVVNAVGVVAFGPVQELSIDAMEELFLTNTFVPIMLARAALPVMTEGGVLVNISGVIAEQNLPGMAAYGASKAAVRSFDEALAREARRRRIRVIDARPPHTETGLAERANRG